LAAILHVAPNTAKSHLASLYRKLGVHSRERALACRVGM
jgi:DNA-binding CsgD family transcriptional regulator